MNYQKNRIKAILNEIEPNSRILDIGCVARVAEKEKKRTWLHKKLYDKSHEVLGIDIRADEIQKLKEKGYNVKHANAESLSFDNKFDIVVAGELIEHLSNPGLFLESVYEKLEDDGKFILTTPNPWSIQYFRKIFLYKKTSINPEHNCWYDEETITHFLKRYRFKVKKTRYILSNKALFPRFFYQLGYKKIGGTVILIVANKN